MKKVTQQDDAKMFSSFLKNCGSSRMRILTNNIYLCTKYIYFCFDYTQIHQISECQMERLTLPAKSKLH